MVWYNPFSWRKQSQNLRRDGVRIDVIGHPGTPVFGGVLRPRGETNPALMGPDQWGAIASQMLRDGTILACWNATLKSLLTASYTWAPGDETDHLSRVLADSANKHFGFAGYGTGKMLRSWRQQITAAYLYLPYGFKWCETRWEVVPDSVMYGIVGHAMALELDPMAKQLSGPGIDPVLPWEDREVASTRGWVFDESGRLSAIEQHFPIGDLRGQSGCLLVPARNVLLLSHMQEGSNPEGIGLLRGCYGPWMQKRDARNFSATALDVWSRPIPIVDVDERAIREDGVPRADVERMIADVEIGISEYMKGNALALRRNSYVSISWDGPKMDPSLSDAHVTSLDTEILRVWLSQFLNLGSAGTGGSRAVGEVHSDLMQRSLIAATEDVCEVFSGVDRPGGGLIGRWVDHNVQGVRSEQLPVMKSSGLSIDPILELIGSGQFQSLIEKGGLGRYGKADIDGVRRRLGLDPEVEEEESGE